VWVILFSWIYVIHLNFQSDLHFKCIPHWNPINTCKVHISIDSRFPRLTPLDNVWITLEWLISWEQQLSTMLPPQYTPSQHGATRIQYNIGYWSWLIDPVHVIWPSQVNEYIHYCLVWTDFDVCENELLRRMWQMKLWTHKGMCRLENKLSTHWSLERYWVHLYFIYATREKTFWIRVNAFHPFGHALLFWSKLSYWSLLENNNSDGN
jgi:hypothetical protein